MAQHIDAGKMGEELAATYLLERGYVIVRRNWRYGRYEIDIIALKENMLHFIEVKLRSSTSYGFPEEQVTKKKFSFLTRAAEEFLYRHPGYRDIRFDILSINLVAGSGPEFFFIEDVFL